VIRLALGTAAAVAMCALAVYAANTWYGPWLGVGVVVIGVALIFQEDKAQRNLEVFERRQARRDERWRDAA
jgi:hypothetical protein